MWQRSHEKGSLDEIKLELRLAPPGEQNEKSIKNTLNLQDAENNAFSMPSSVNSALSNRSQNRYSCFLFFIYLCYSF